MRAPERMNASEDAKTLSLIQKWADGKATLKDVRGYSDEELYSIANEARVLFQGLYAVNPLDAYFARALGVVEFAAGNAQGALSAYDVAVKLSPQDPSSYVGRAEVKISLGQRNPAADDLRRAVQLSTSGQPINVKAFSMLEALGRR
jgi:predicted Zn-dependent protease